MDIVFALAYNEGVSPVGVSFRKDLPAAGSPEADRILGYEPKVDRHQVHESQEKQDA